MLENSYTNIIKNDFLVGFVLAHHDNRVLWFVNKFTHLFTPKNSFKPKLCDRNNRHFKHLA